MANIIKYPGAAFPFSFARQNSAPLDNTAVLATLSDLNTYAANLDKSYVPYRGQIISCEETDAAYILISESGKLVPKKIASDLPPLTDYATKQWVLDKGYWIDVPTLRSQWNEAYNLRHSHANKLALDGIIQTDISSWNNAGLLAHDHANKTVLDTITSQSTSNWNQVFGWGNHGDQAYAKQAITITAGSGLTGGGNLSANRTISLSNSGVLSGTYTKFNVDVYGRVTSGTTLIQADIPTLSISKVSGLQQALDGSLGQEVFNDMFEKVNVGTVESPSYVIKAKYGFFSVGEVSAYGSGGSGGGGGTGLIQTVYSYPQLGGSFSDTTLTDTFNAYTINKIHTDFINHTHTFTSLTGKPTTLSGYGITDSVLNTDIRLTNSRPASDVYPWAKAVDKPSYSYGEITGTPPTADLSNYVTLSAAQTITGQKTFTAGIWLNHTLIADAQDAVSLYTKEFGGQGLNLRSLLVSADYSYRQYVPDQGAYFVGDVKAYSFVKHNGNHQQLLRADGGVADFIWSGQPDQPTWLWGGNSQHDYKLWNPSNFNVATSVSSAKINPTMCHLVDVNTLYEDSFIRFYSLINRDSSNIFPRAHNASGILSFSTHPGSYGHQIGFSSDVNLYHRVIEAGTYVTSWRKILNDSNWQSIVDGRYLPLSGGTMTGDLNSNNQIRTDVWFRNTRSGYGLYNEAQDAHWFADSGSWHSSKELLVNNNLVWNAGNDGTGSGLDADLLDGVHGSGYLLNRPSGAGSNLDLNNVDKIFIGPGWGVTNSPFPGDQGVISIPTWNNYGKYTAQFVAQLDTYNLCYRTTNVYGEGAWKYVAFIDSNVASATKLQTPRTIWGQSFDGTGNVDGVFRNIVGTPSSHIISHKTLAHQSSPYGLITRIWVGGEVSLQAQRESNDSEVFPLLLNTNGGNVGIGTTNPLYKLDVSGTGRFTGNVTAPTFIGNLTGNASSATILETSRAINGTNFNGSSAITTSLWGTARTFTFGTDTSGSISVNGSGNLTFPITVNVATALRTPRAINGTNFNGTAPITTATWGASRTFTFGTDVSGSIAVDGSGNVTFPMTVLRATELRTPRTIWGQSFNGAANVTGAITGVTTISASGQITAGSFSGNIAGNATTATTLQTSRTIWGQSFDGSAVVSGALSGATTGLFSGQVTAGGVYSNGNIVATGEVSAYSDRRLKSNIRNLDNRGRLSAKTFLKDNKQQIGFIAQDVQELYPELISTTSGPEQYLSLNYGAITAVLSIQINDVEDEVTILKEKVKQLENKIKQYEEINF